MIISCVLHTFHWPLLSVLCYLVVRLCCLFCCCITCLVHDRYITNILTDLKFDWKISLPIDRFSENSVGGILFRPTLYLRACVSPICRFSLQSICIRAQTQHCLRSVFLRLRMRVHVQSDGLSLRRDGMKTSCKTRFACKRFVAPAHCRQYDVVETRRLPSTVWQYQPKVEQILVHSH